MEIHSIEVYNFDLSYIHGVYTMSGGRDITVLPSTLVRLVSNSGHEGWGEVCPLGSAYLPQHAEGARAALRLLAPALLGVDPTNHAAVYDTMDTMLMGHAYAKSALDVACWDLTGKAWGASIAEMLGGVRQQRFPLYFAVPLGDPEQMSRYVLERRAEGIHRFQLKIGGDPTMDSMRAKHIIDSTGPEDLVIGDANCGWRLNEALIAARAMEHLPRFYLEQPCPSMEECIEVRRHTSLPMVYDEIVNDANSLIRAVREGGAGAFNLKVSKVGGLTKARLMRDLAQELGVQVTVEDTWGGDIVSAASAHIAASTRQSSLLSVSFMNDWTSEHVAGHCPRSREGIGSAPTAPGLGIEVDVAALGAPLFRCQR